MVPRRAHQQIASYPTPAAPVPRGHHSFFFIQRQFSLRLPFATRVFSRCRITPIFFDHFRQSLSSGNITAEYPTVTMQCSGFDSCSLAKYEWKGDWVIQWAVAYSILWPTRSWITLHLLRGTIDPDSIRRIAVPILYPLKTELLISKSCSFPIMSQRIHHIAVSH
jgi:hypothetical protein